MRFSFRRGKFGNVIPMKTIKAQLAVPFGKLLSTYSIRVVFFPLYNKNQVQSQSISRFHFRSNKCWWSLLYKAYFCHLELCRSCQNPL